MACFLGKISRGGDDAIIDLLENTCHSCYATRMYQTTDVFLELTCSCPSWSNLILTSIAVDLSSNAHPLFRFFVFHAYGLTPLLDNALLWSGRENPYGHGMPRKGS